MSPYIHAFGHDFPAYGLMCALGIIAALALSLARARRAGLRLDTAFVLFTLSLSAGLIGAVLAYGLITYGFVNPLSMLTGERPLGFVFYGGILCGLPAALLVMRVLKIPFSPYLNALAPAVPLGHALGRVGCFLAGCCYGRETALPIAVHYPAGHVTLGQGVVPVQLIEAACLMALCVFLLIHRRHEARLYVAVYAVLRLFLEFLRGDAIRGAFLGLSTSQWVCVLLLICLYIWKKRHSSLARNQH